VTEAGEAEDGRIKSAVGIGTLLEDGLGDTVRVSLTEEPEEEAPVAQALVDRYLDRKGHPTIPKVQKIPIDPFSYHRRNTHEVFNFGDENVPRVIADLSRFEIKEYKELESVGHFYLPELDKWTMNDHGTDFIYTGDRPVGFMLPNGLKEIVNYEVWKDSDKKDEAFPLIEAGDIEKVDHWHKDLNFIRISLPEANEALYTWLKERNNVVLLLHTDNPHAMPEMRRFYFDLINREITNPVVNVRSYPDLTEDQILLYASTDVGGLLIDGLGDGIMLGAGELDDRGGQKEWFKTTKFLNSTAFGVLQAARTRMTKTEYISCPSCGRTLFDLQETTAMIRKRTDHLKGVKIGIMGCIVNGPGEMADADYGYVGSGRGKITLYKGQEVMKKGIPSERALDELIELIKSDGRWIDPKTTIV
jgi:(E)-4-hydroxy-3-methylbut-2-enyl-diphosphate synthase